MAGITEYVLHGESATSLAAFYIVMGETVNGPGGYFGNNLDALVDCLRGGFGTPDEFRLRWVNSAASRRLMNHRDAAAELFRRLAKCHPSNRIDVTAKLARAIVGVGPTTFDWVVEIIRDARNVELILE